MKNKRAIVFGSEGYVGKHLVSALQNAGFIVFPYDKITDQSVSTISVSIDITNPTELLMIDWNVDVVFMFAGITGTIKGFYDYKEYIKVNELGLLNLLTEIHNSDYSPRIVFPSTRLIYKGKNNPLKEDDVKETKTIYAVNKLACENLLEVYSNFFDIKFTIYRICIPYGNNFGTAYSYGTIGFFINQAIKSHEITLYGDGLLRRSFSHINDICNIIIDTCLEEYSLNQIFNVPGENYSLLQIAELIAKKYNSKIRFVDWPLADKKIESGHTVFDSTKISYFYNQAPLFHFNSWLNNID